MLQIDDTIISFDVLDEQFVCDLASCKGACCVEGDAGAPLTETEIGKLEELLPLIMDDLPEVSREVISRQGVFYIDEDNEPVTSIVDGRECVFAYTDKGVWKCAVEKAYREGKTDFIKPLSCHLYPVRVKQYDSFRAVNYQRWKICECAVANGTRLKVPVYRFLKEPLIRAFGKEWYQQLDIAAKELKQSDK
ncbi:MAG: DUF3109 family protein [Paludibacter sp.]|nr:DUF3109 family protein [Paludibacter sp.]